MQNTDLFSQLESTLRQFPGEVMVLFGIVTLIVAIIRLEDTEGLKRKMELYPLYAYRRHPYWGVANSLLFIGIGFLEMFGAITVGELIRLILD